MLAIDANIFLELLLKQEKYEECKYFLSLVRDGKIHAIISDFTISGIVIVMERYGAKWKDLRLFLLSLARYSGLHVYQANIQDKILATRYMQKYGLDFDDALTLQCAQAAKCTALVSFDSDFDKSIKRITPNQIKI
jgi:predicted nucleic acid-binding protein